MHEAGPEGTPVERQLKFYPSNEEYFDYKLGLNGSLWLYVPPEYAPVKYPVVGIFYKLVTSTKATLPSRCVSLLRVCMEYGMFATVKSIPSWVVFLPLLRTSLTFVRDLAIRSPHRESITSQDILQMPIQIIYFPFR